MVYLWIIILIKIESTTCIVVYTGCLSFFNKFLIQLKTKRTSFIASPLRQAIYGCSERNTKRTKPLPLLKI